MTCTRTSLRPTPPALPKKRRHWRRRYPADDSKDYDALVGAPGFGWWYYSVPEGYIGLWKLNNKCQHASRIFHRRTPASVGAEIDVIAHSQTYHAMLVYMLRRTAVFFTPPKVRGSWIKSYSSQTSTPSKKKAEINPFTSSPKALPVIHCIARH